MGSQKYHGDDLQESIDRNFIHPDARLLLDDSLFWERANDLAPHGNDTGSDLFEEFRDWNECNPGGSPASFLSALMTKWGIEPIGWDLTADSEIDRMHRENPNTLRVCNEAAIALAFAVVKLRGTCSPDVIRIALGALKRTAFCVKKSSLDDSAKAMWDRAIEIMERKLKSIIPSA